jgi:hypothetical protein
MARFLVIAPHDPEECLDAIEQTINQGPGFAEAYDWGCLVGDHTGYVRVRADGPQEALDDYVPAFLRARAVVRRVFTITGRDLRTMREDADAGRRRDRGAGQ